MIEAPHYSASGTRHQRGFALPADLFDGTVHEAALHQAVKTYLGNQRQGTAKTRTRAFVSGGNRKPWRQKGTGRARQGSIRSPLWRGGGTVFGPIPRDYRTSVPRKVRQLARRSALNARAREGNLVVLDPVSFEAPKTKQLAGLLEKMGLADRKVLVLTNGVNRNLYLAGRNLPRAEVMPFGEASAYDVLWADTVVVEQGVLGDGQTVRRPGGQAVSEVEGEAVSRPGGQAVSEVEDLATAPSAEGRVPSGEEPKRRVPSRRAPSAEPKRKPVAKKPAAAKKAAAKKPSRPVARRPAKPAAKKPKKKE
ncbi:MAG: 50S ribosomal protein L4 [Gemmatimonadales bacterium]